MTNFFSLITLLFCIIIVYGEQDDFRHGSSVSQAKVGAAVDEVVVESSLYIKKKQIRRVRDANYISHQNVPRIKRQHGHRRHPAPFGSSQSSANAAANNNFFGPNGFGASAANAQAQGFQSQGPLGGFGASAANTQTQSFTAGRNGLQGSAGASTSQVYNLPNGKKINVAFSNGFSTGPTGLSGSNSNSVTYS